MADLLLYAALAGAIFGALRTETRRMAARRRWTVIAKQIEPAVAALAALGITFAEAQESIERFTSALIDARNAAWFEAASEYDAAPGMTLDELLGDIDTVIEEHHRG